MFRSLTPSQEKTIGNVHDKCKDNCDFLHPVDLLASKECANLCSEQNRELFRMANASDWAAVGALIILLIAIWIGLTHKK